MNYPRIIQGGMGAGVSSWRLARAVSMEGQLGVVSGTALATLVLRVLQSGDPGGHVARARDAFPNRRIAERVYGKYFVEGGVPAGSAFKRHPMYTLSPPSELVELTVFAAFAEVYLAKEGHEGLVGINLLEKIVLPNLPSLYGALLAGVDYVLMGAGIPMEIPGALDALADHQPFALRVAVAGAPKGAEHCIQFDPAAIVPAPASRLKRPLFLAIIASNVLAVALKKRANGRIDGFVVEGPTAGGHNAPPRGAPQLNEKGEPVYGTKDIVDLAELKKLGLPFWLAGSCASPERLREALDQGAAGIQAGTAFALCEESGMTPELRAALVQGLREGSLEVFTDPLASPTGFPFKVAQLPGTMATQEDYGHRPRRCDLGYLRVAYMKENGGIDFRCPAEPVDQFVAKGGSEAETAGRKCLCNGLTGTVGYPQRQPGGYLELALVTIGDDVRRMARYFTNGRTTITAAEVIRLILGEDEPLPSPSPA
ncbi:MAG: nitronate monooxygenase [Candidatus Hydrogenedentes bacterium]|nr:nitronate monooxygenase [Candidatus Hydrogenedentota bacterium]